MPAMDRCAERLNIAGYFLDDRISEGKGGNTAIYFNDKKYTYSDVQRLANKFAGALQKIGIGFEDRVMIILHDTPEYAGALFGILKAGAVVVMLNPLLKKDDFEYFLNYTRAKCAIVCAESAEEFGYAAKSSRFLKEAIIIGAERRNFVCWDDLSRLCSDEFETAPTHKHDPAIWLFSGGTTGRPKAVIQTHQSFVNTTELYAKGVIGYSERDITISVPKLFFGYATGSNLFFPFSVGAGSVLFSERATPETLIKKIRQYRPTILINVPTMINHLVQYAGAKASDFRSLRLTTSAGEALPVELYNQWKKKFNVEILDGLGTAEMWHIFISNRPDDVRPGSLGKVVPGFEVKVCDENGSPIPDGETGYLWVKGDSRAIGYFQKLDETARSFKGEWYITGDMVSRDGDGYFYYSGRADDLMKVSGKWVSPKEVENALLKHDSVKECAVVPFTDESGLVKPRAFIVLKEPAAKSESLAEELKKFVKDNIEPYKYPRIISFLDSLPRTHLGKVDRHKLKTIV